MITWSDLSIIVLIIEPKIDIFDLSSNLIVTCVQLVPFLNYKPCHILLKYRCQNMS
jgi:hypothetical protein